MKIKLYSITLKHTLFPYTMKKKGCKSRCQFANALNNSDICAFSAGATVYLEQPLKWATNSLSKIAQLKPP
jgi:hypothetical protein